MTPTTKCHYEAWATLSEYAGNFQRELTAWVFGAESEYMPGGWERKKRPHAEAMAWAYDYPNKLEGTLQLQEHYEYGMVWETLGETDANTVVWRFSEPPTDEQWDALVAAIKSYEVPPKSYLPAKVTLVDIKLLKVETTYVSVR